MWAETPWLCVFVRGGERGNIRFSWMGGGIDTANTCPHVDQIWNIFGKILSFQLNRGSTTKRGK